MKIKVNLRWILLVLWVIGFGLETRFLATLANFSTENISRQFGSFIFINLQIVFVFAIMILSVLQNSFCIRIKKKNCLIPLFMVLLIRSMIPLFTVNYTSSMVGGANILIQFVSSMILLNMCSRDELWKALDVGFLILLIIEIGVGFLYYAGISIPFLTAEGEGFGVRSGWLRMQGTLKHPASLSFLLVFIFLYYASKAFYNKDKKAMGLMALSYVGIYFTFARTALLVSSMLLIILLWIYYRKHIFIKVLIGIIVTFVAIQVALSEWFTQMFVEQSVVDMFMARFIHWIIGWRIMTNNIFNFLFGVGVNNNVDYIIKNYYHLVSGLSKSTILTADFALANPIHNSYFIIGAEAGIGGLFVYGYTLIKMAFGSIKPLLKNKGIITGANAFIAYAVMWYAIYALQGWGALDELGIPMLCLIMVLYEKEKEIRKKHQVV